MSRVSKWMPGLLLCALAAGCAGSAQMIGVWSDPTAQTLDAQKVLVFGLGENEGLVKMFESEMGKQFAQYGVANVTSSSLFPVGQPVDTNSVRQYVNANQIDLVSVTRVVGLSKESEYIPGSTYYTPAPSYYGFYPYYYSSYQVVSTPGYMREYKVATVETNVYSAKNEKLVWSGQSKILDPASLNQAFEDISVLLVGEMSRAGMFKKKK